MALTSPINSLENPYKIKDNYVYWGSSKIKDADVDSFIHLGGDWGKDGKSIYCQGSRKKLDYASFEYLNPVYVKDKNGVYDWEGLIKKADPLTFKVLDSGYHTSFSIYSQIWIGGYAKDDNQVYYHEQMEGRATAIRGANPTSFISFGNGFGKDNSFVYQEKIKIKKADPDTWAYIGRGYSFDSQRIFYLDRELPVKVNRGTFTVIYGINGNYATDGTSFFDNDKKIKKDKFLTKIEDQTNVVNNWFNYEKAQLNN